MKVLNEHTAEAWMLDYLEGRLSDADTRALMDFVEQNPHWKEVLEEMQGDVLPVLEATVSFPSKAELHQDEDEDLIALMEGALSPADAARMEKNLEQNPELSASYQLYLKTRLHPHESLRFVNKKALKHTPVRMMYALRFSAAAATIAAIVGAWLWFNPANQSQYNPRLSGQMPLWETEAVEAENPVAADYEQTKATNPAAEETLLKSNTPKEENAFLLAEVSLQKTSESSELPEASAIDGPENTEQPTLLASKLEPQHAIHLKIEEIEIPGILADAESAAAPNPQWMNTPERGLVGDALAGMGDAFAGLGENITGRLKSIVQKQQLVEIEKVEEDELITSTFKLGQLEIQRSRTKK